ncbi:MAG: hypothetical protein MN733_42500 [Nitrososphaera sp.]|nr:hypothetical protein [Nitrososphaera sp.]
MSNLTEQLLADVPTEEVRNPDAGPHEDATFDGGDLNVTSKGGYQIVSRFTVPRVDGAGTIRHREYINLPQSESHPRVKQMGLGWYQAFGIVPKGSKNVPMADTKEAAEKIIAAINTLSGSTVGITLSEDDTGFLRARPLRTRS